MRSWNLDDPGSGAGASELPGWNLDDSASAPVSNDMAPATADAAAMAADPGAGAAAVQDQKLAQMIQDLAAFAPRAGEGSWHDRHGPIMPEYAYYA
jgi:hypothetical protein